MDVDLLYGRGRLAVRLPDALQVTLVRKPPMPIATDPATAVRAALAAPVAARPLAEEARGKQSACVVVCDVTRPVPNGLLLGPVLRELLAAGLQPERVTVLVATGLHRPNAGAELAELLGDPWVLERFPVVNHDARDAAAHVDLGPTARGTPVKLDRRLVEAELRIVTGLVEPHFMAGWSGGRKVIAPGVAHADTITTFHSARFMAHPAASNCTLDGNPLHEEQLAIAAKLGRVLAVNTVLDEERRLAFVSYGEVVASHLAAVAFAERYALVEVPRRFRTVVTSAAGHPLDQTYYQTVKGMVGPLAIAAPGAHLVIASACAEGMGSRAYVAAQRRLLAQGPAAFLAGLHAKRTAEVDEWQTQEQLKAAAAVHLHLFTDGLSAEERALTGVALASSVEEAVRASVEESGDPAVAVIPEGPYVVPVVAGERARA